jgi:hypothetical protein
MCPQDPVDLTIRGDLHSRKLPVMQTIQQNFKLRITHPANFGFWSSLAKATISERKRESMKIGFFKTVLAT